MLVRWHWYPGTGVLVLVALLTVAPIHHALRRMLIVPMLPWLQAHAGDRLTKAHFPLSLPLQQPPLTVLSPIYPRRHLPILSLCTHSPGHFLRVSSGMRVGAHLLLSPLDVPGRRGAFSSQGAPEECPGCGVSCHVRRAVAGAFPSVQGRPGEYCL